MDRTEKFIMRVSKEDKAIFAELAKRLNRNQSDAIRVLAHEFLRISKHEDEMMRLETKHKRLSISTQ